ncbi:MAG: hypothetical protein GXP28_01110, partial [Planctomycetes bacterium]|nr:hypothetical protein [Planctomycetota bacterium]
MPKNLASTCLVVWVLLISCLGCGKPAAEPAIPQSQTDRPLAESSLPAPTDPEPEATAPEESSPEESDPAEPPRLPAPEGADPMPEPNHVWIDRKQGTVIVDGYVSLREGMLEMFACPAGTKEHESVVAVYSQAQIVHAALLALGAEVGSPVQFDPEFKPPTGTEIAIEVHWLDEAGNWQSTDAQQWILDIRTQKPMTHPWVFAGSGFWKDEESGEEFYMAESGDFICVSNFSTATLDIPAESSQVNEGLMFEA